MARLEIVGLFKIITVTYIVKIISYEKIFMKNFIKFIFKSIINFKNSRMYFINFSVKLP